jgi:DivIVA domain-containing protein
MRMMRGISVGALIALLGVAGGLPNLFIVLCRQAGTIWAIALACTLGIGVIWLVARVVNYLARALNLDQSATTTAAFIALIILLGYTEVALTPIISWSYSATMTALATILIYDGMAAAFLLICSLYMHITFWSTFPRMLQIYIRPTSRRALRRIGAATPWEITVGAFIGTSMAIFRLLYLRSSDTSQMSERELKANLDESVRRWREAASERFALPFLQQSLFEVTSPRSHVGFPNNEAMLTPADVRNKQFSTTRLRPGYDEEEVDVFLDEVEDVIARLTAENAALRSRLRGGPGKENASSLSSPLADSMPYMEATQRPALAAGRSRDSYEELRLPDDFRQMSPSAVVSDRPFASFMNDVIVEEEIQHAHGVIQRFNFGSNNIVLVDQTPTGSTVNWSTFLAPRSFLTIARELLGYRDGLEVQLTINETTSEMTGDLLFALSESWSNRLDQACRFVRIDSRESSIAFQALPSTTGSEARLIGISSKNLDPTLLMSLLLRTASPPIVERALGLGEDSFILRVATLLREESSREDGSKNEEG